MSTPSIVRGEFSSDNVFFKTGKPLFGIDEEDFSVEHVSPTRHARRAFLAYESRPAAAQLARTEALPRPLAFRLATRPVPIASCLPETFAIA